MRGSPLELRFSVLTGETGAGKTMVVTALGFPGRPIRRLQRATVLRAPSPNSDSPAHGHRALELAEEAGGTAGVTKQTSRTASGAHRQRLGTLPRPRRRLLRTHRNPVSDWSDSCCSHGQSDQLRLKSAAEQQSLDLYAGEELANLLEKYRETTSDTAPPPPG